jgi:hypothetical protein
MAWLSTTHLAAPEGGAGKVFVSRPTTGTLANHKEIAVPSGFKITKTRPSVAGYNGRAYYAGLGSDNFLVDEYYRGLRQGMIPPNTVPTLATSGTGVTGSAITAIAWYDPLTDEWSHLSASSSAVTLTNQGRNTGNIPATPPEARYTHFGVFVSMDGAAFRLSTKRQAGVTSVIENVATLSLVSITGITDGSGFERAPRAAYNTFYHDRQVWAGDSRHPDTVYVSVIGLPERYEGLSFRTRNGEPIVGLGANRDVCLVFTPFSYYVLRGYTNDDMTLTLGDSDIGCMSHHTIQVINDRIWWANNKGVWMYNGAPHFMIRDRETEWQRLYQDFRDDFEDAFAVVDPNANTYSIVLGSVTTVGSVSGDVAHTAFEVPDPDGTTPSTFAWVADLSDVIPELGGSMGQPGWYMDVWDRTTECAAVLSIPGSRRRDPYYGNCDGTIRYYAPEATSGDYTTDDDDGYGKLVWIRSKAYDFGDPGGDLREGKEFVRLWTYLEAEYDAWTLYCQGGDEKAYEQVLPDNEVNWWMNNVTASRLTAASVTIPNAGSFDNVTWARKSVHAHLPQRVSGRCLTLQYSIPTAGPIHWRGFGGTYRAGEATRDAVLLDEGGV